MDIISFIVGAFVGYGLNEFLQKNRKTVKIPTPKLKLDKNNQIKEVEF